MTAADQIGPKYSSSQLITQLESSVHEVTAFDCLICFNMTAAFCNASDHTFVSIAKSRRPVSGSCRIHAHAAAVACVFIGMSEMFNYSSPC